MNKEFYPKSTSCGYNIVCKGMDDCPVMKTTEYQLTESIKMRHNYQGKDYEMNREIAELFLDNSVNVAGDCPNSNKIRIRGKDLIEKHFTAGR